MDEHFVINLRVADMRYPLRVKRVDEIIYRNAASEIDYKLSQYKEHFAGNSEQPLQKTDYMAMTAIQAVAEKVEYEMRADLFESHIRQLTAELDDYLKKHGLRR